MEPVTIWLLALATLWLLRMLVEELVAAIRGKDSPRIARREAREQLAEQHGTPTVGQAITNRLARRIENPPQRRWAAEVRQFLAELTADAVAEARVRHHVNMRARAQRRGRAAGWTAQTGGTATPPPTPAAEQPGEDDTDTAVPCWNCGDVLVVPPDELCDACDRATADPNADPEPADDTPTEPIPDLEETPMADQTHTIDADVRDPRTALRFASKCCGFTDAVLGELDVLAANMTRAGVGAAPIQEIRVLADDVRNYSRSAERSIRAYEQHCVAQGDIAADEDVAGTVRRTYLDTHGSDGAATGSRRGGGSHTLRAADCDTPAAGERFMAACAGVFAEMKVSVDQVKGAHERQGVSGDPIAFLDEQLGLATGIADKSASAARTFRAHSRRRDDTVGKDSSLHGTQDGRYLDPARA